MSFAVIDFETTGLVPERTDRVVEVGVVLTDENGRIEHEWATLVNPHRDLGATHIHGIAAGDVVDAPDFVDIGDYLLKMLSGRVLVAHNASFDMRFLHAELRRASYEIPERPVALCSMKWAGRMIGAATLAHCCEALGISLTNAHSALGDAHSTAELLPHLITCCCRVAQRPGALLIVSLADIVRSRITRHHRPARAGRRRPACLAALGPWRGMDSGHPGG